MDDDSTSALAELTPAIAADVLSLPDLQGTEWDTYSMAADVSGFSVTMTAYRYTELGPPVPTEGPVDSYPFIVLRDRTRGVDGQAWDVVLVKIDRDTADLVMDFVSGAAADRWRVTPANMAHLPESLRPRREDFERS